MFTAAKNAAASVSKPAEHAVSGEVMRSLYRSIMKEARVLDADPVLKTLLPIPKKLQTVAGVNSALYVPGSIQYTDVVRMLFRNKSEESPASRTQLAFESLTTLRNHRSAIEKMLTQISQDHKPLVDALSNSLKETAKGKYIAKPIYVPTLSGCAMRARSRAIMQSIAKEIEQEEKKASASKSSQKESEQGEDPEKLVGDLSSPEGVAKAIQSLEAPASSILLKKIVLEKLQQLAKTELTAPIAPAPAPPSGKSGPPARTDALATTKRNQLVKLAGFDVRVGTGLIAHPLSSAHADRRVMLVVESNQHVTTALVLDLVYSYPLSHGNPMFPEVLWGHEVYNGGYCHVDFTMPPTANVSILHTLSPPADKSNPAHRGFLSWISKSSAEDTPANNEGDTAKTHHERHCKEIIPGRTTKEGVVLPPLYYSRVEALPYLAALAPGQPRSSLRVYWGCMKWATSQLLSEVAAGHWLPVDLSPDFFGAYPVKPVSGSDLAPGASEADEDIVEEKTDQSSTPSERSKVPEASSSKDLTRFFQISRPRKEGQPVDRFPTEEELKSFKEQRVKHFGVDVSPPQTFPPDQPMCRREPLWDQVLHSIGGEHLALVGVVNPFAAEMQQKIPMRVPPVDVVQDQIRRLLGRGDDDDDDDDE